MSNSLGKPEDFLHNAADILTQKRDEYPRNNWEMVVKCLDAMFPEGIEIKGAADMSRFHILGYVVAKTCRYACNFDRGGHADSMDDCISYSAILRHLDENGIGE